MMLRLYSLALLFFQQAITLIMVVSAGLILTGLHLMLAFEPTEA